MTRQSTQERKACAATDAARRGERVEIHGSDVLTVARTVARARFLAEVEGVDTMLIRAANPEHRFVPFGDVAHGRLSEQSQYASRYIDGRLDYPNCGEWLRFLGVPTDYHSVMIHEDDVDTFVARVTEHRKAGR